MSASQRPDNSEKAEHVDSKAPTKDTEESKRALHKARLARMGEISAEVQEFSVLNPDFSTENLQDLLRRTTSNSITEERSDPRVPSPPVTNFFHLASCPRVSLCMQGASSLSPTLASREDACLASVG